MEKLLIRLRVVSEERGKIGECGVFEVKRRVFK